MEILVFLAIVGWIVWAVVANNVRERELEDLERFVKNKKLNEYPFKACTEEVLSYNRYFVHGKQSCRWCSCGRMRPYTNENGKDKIACNNTYCVSNKS